MKQIHIALDLDSTLAFYESKWKAQKVGTAIIPMLENVKKWLAKGYKVTIFSARLSHEGEDLVNQIRMIRAFLKEHDLNLPMTATKKAEFSHFIDDKAYHVVPNSGIILNCPPELL
jgi:hypothetical protein